MATPPTGEFATIFASSCGAPRILNAAGTGCWTEGNPFSGFQLGYYWSSTTDANTPNSAWYAHLSSGGVSTSYTNATYDVWPVRGGP